jgi:hypothetical protein
MATKLQKSAQALAIRYNDGALTPREFRDHLIALLGTIASSNSDRPDLDWLGAQLMRGETR